MISPARRSLARRRATPYELLPFSFFLSRYDGEMAATDEQQQGHPRTMPATFSFTDKVVVVTGASRGLGRVTALGFARAGAKIAISDIDDPGGEETLRLLRSEGGEGLY